MLTAINYQSSVSARIGYGWSALPYCPINTSPVTVGRAPRWLQWRQWQTDNEEGAK